MSTPEIPEFPTEGFKLTFECGCGYVRVLGRYDGVWHVVDGAVTEAGTAFPAEASITCPKCEREHQVLG